MSDNKLKSGSGQGNDEIDLIQLFKSFGDFIARIFKGLFNAILQIILFSIRKWIYFIVAIIVGFGISYLQSRIQQDLFYSDLILKSNAVPNQEMISYINRLHNLTSESNFNVIANSLDISIEDAEQLNDIRAYWFVDMNKDGLVDGIDLDNKFLADTNVAKIEWKLGVRATVRDPGILEKVAGGIEHYVKSNSYFKSMNDVRLNNLREIIDQTGLEVEKLDSLQKKEYFRLQDVTRLKEGQLIFTNEPEIKLFHEDILALVRAKQVSQRELTIHNEIISVLENFVITQNPTNGLTYYATRYVPALLGLAYILALLITFWKEIEKAVRN